MLLVVLKFRHYLVNPWTRDGQVRADVVQITPRVSGQVVQLAVKNNQLVTKGDLLFQIDPRSFEAALAQARAQLDATGDSYLAEEKKVRAAEAQVREARAAVQQARSAVRALDAEIVKAAAELERQRQLLPQRATSRRLLEAAKASFEYATQQKKGAEAQVAEALAAQEQAEAGFEEVTAALGALGAQNPSIRAARAAVQQAELNLEYTSVTAPVSGYVTNVDLRLGDQAVANHAEMAMVNTESYWVDAFFRETFLSKITAGDRAIVTLMAYPDQPIQGYVESIGWGISQQNGAAGTDLLPNVSPTFEWIRLAQRVPVRIQLEDVPEEIILRVGITGSVLIKSGSAERSKDAPAPTP
nr:HlyD family secretion protein [Microbulbifer guangxiensis]